MKKIILAISILSIILTAGVMAVEASDENKFFSGWKENIKQRIDEFKSMTPEERKVKMEEFRLEFKNPGKNQAAMDAIENNDYEAWLTATEGKKNIENITEENFQKMVEARDLMKSGDQKGAKVIMKELGLNRSFRAAHSFGKGFRGMDKCHCECEK